MKPPKFTGHKKGKAEIWIGDSDRRYELAWQRIRIRYPNGKWYWANMAMPMSKWHSRPCWCEPSVYNYFSTDKIANMKIYDKACGRKTIFLGYF